MVEGLKEAVKKTGKVMRGIGFSGKRYWPAGVLNTLETEFHLKPEDMLRLGYMRRHFGRRNRIYYLYIYDKYAASDRKLSVNDVNDIYNSPDLLIFKGSVTVDGVIHLARVSDFAFN